MYHIGVNRFRGVRHGGSDNVEAIKSLRQRRLRGWAIACSLLAQPFAPLDNTKTSYYMTS